MSRTATVVHLEFVTGSFDRSGPSEDDEEMPKTVSVDERLLKSYRAELARRTTFFNRRP